MPWNSFRRSASRKHPHGCGEDSRGNGRLQGIEETPPRVWGRFPEFPLSPEVQGNTPTGVGKISWSNDDEDATQKHPHGCGEDRFLGAFSRKKQETPPRVWGRSQTTGIPKASPRNTPTGVGKISKATKIASFIRKHPHGCGEDHEPRRVHSWRSETPPRVWGRFPAFAFAEGGTRNTPTGVGKISCAICRNERPGKHPHGCGEDTQRRNLRRFWAETPPRVWGRSRKRGYRVKIDRNTPTGVGKIVLSATVPTPAQKHPHGCGEDAGASARIGSGRETPPRVWGRSWHQGQQTPPRGNTHTGVGKILSS